MPYLHDASIGDLRVLCAVAQSGSISAAASSLGYSQSGLSRRVAALERIVGTSLVVRLPRGIRLTDDGQQLYSHAVRILQTVALAERELSAVLAGARSLRVGTFSTANSTILPTVLTQLANTDADLRITVREQRSAGLLKSVAAGALDVALVSDYPTGLPAPPAGVVLEPIAQDPVVLALPTSHPLVSARFSFHHLASDRWIEGDAIELPVLRAAGADAGFDPVIAYRVRDWNTKLAYVAAGLGVALVPGLAAATTRPEIAFRRLPGTLPTRTIAMAYARSAVDDASVRAFARAARRVVRDTEQRLVVT